MQANNVNLIRHSECQTQVDLTKRSMMGCNILSGNRLLRNGHADSPVGERLGSLRLDIKSKQNSGNAPSI